MNFVFFSNIQQYMNTCSGDFVADNFRQQHYETWHFLPPWILVLQNVFVGMARPFKLNMFYYTRIQCAMFWIHPLTKNQIIDTQAIVFCLCCMLKYKHPLFLRIIFNVEQQKRKQQQQQKKTLRIFDFVFFVYIKQLYTG